MELSRFIAAAALVVSSLTMGVGVASAQPMDPPGPVPTAEPDPSAPVHLPAEKCWRYGRSGGGSPRGGGGMPGYLPQCPVDTAPPD
jgi:hypothetical protein